MLSSIEFQYANAIRLYKRIDGHGEKLRAGSVSFVWCAGICIFLLNILQSATGPLAPVARDIFPFLNKPYNNPAEIVFAIPPALIINYFLFTKRTDVLLLKYGGREKSKGNRLFVVIGFLFSVGFAFSCGYGRVDLLKSAIAAGVIFIVHELIFYFAARKAVR